MKKKNINNHGTRNRSSEKYPKAQNLEDRETRNCRRRKIARQFGKDFLMVKKTYRLPIATQNIGLRLFMILKPLATGSNNSILDRFERFMLYDFMRIIPGISVKGVDISHYAIENCKEQVKIFRK